MTRSRTSKPEATNRAVGYVRVSTEEQATGGVSLDAQSEAVRAYCAMRGLELVELVTDPGVSAGKALDARQGGRRLLELVRSGTVGSVVSYKLDRLFRDCADCLTVTGGWDRAGVSLHLVDMGGQAIDTSTAMGRFFLTVMAGAAEMERNLIRERTRAALQHKQSKGEKTGGACPFGYRLAADGRTLEHEPTEQRVIELVKELRAAGMSIRAVARHLNSDGVPARGRKWHATTVARLLQREAS